MSEAKKPELFTDRRKFLLAATTDGRPKWHAMVNGSREVWGIAATEHQFKLAVADRFIGTQPVKRDSMMKLMQKELAESAGGPQMDAADSSD